MYVTELDECARDIPETFDMKSCLTRLIAREDSTASVAAEDSDRKQNGAVAFFSVPYVTAISDD